MSKMMSSVKAFFGFIEEGEPLQEPVKKERIQSPARPFRGSLISQPKIKASAMSQIHVVEPRIYEDSLEIATSLRDNKPVIVNLKYLDSPTGKRLIDFVCGTAYAINGHMLKIAENIFIFSPASILISNMEDDKSFQDDSHNSLSDLDDILQRQAI